MKKRIMYLIFTKKLLILCIIVFTNLTFSSSFEPLGLGARAKSMAEAVSALCDDNNTVYYNPAGLYNFYPSEIEFGYFDLYNLNLLNYKYASVAVENFGLNFSRLAASEQSAVSYFEDLFVFSYGNKISQDFSYGLNLKFFYANTETKGSGYGLDFGLLYSFYRRKLKVGIVFENLNMPQVIWDTQTKESINPNIKLGVCLTKKDNFATSIDLNSSKPNFFNFGFERYLKNFFAIRSGVRFRVDYLIFTLGFGFRHKNIFIDYAYESENSLGPTHCFSIKFRITK